MTVKTVFAILMILQLSIFAQNEMRVVGKGEFQPSELIDRSIVDANREVCAGLMIVTDLTGLRYTSYNGIVKVNQNPGKDFLFVSPDERVVEVYCTGYAALKIILSEYGVVLRSGEVWKLKVTGDKISDLLPINIVTKPADAQIYIDEKLQNNNAIQVSAGEHRIKIMKEGYQTIEEKINVSVGNTLFNYTLGEVELIPVQITSTPKGAKVFVDGVDRGETPKPLFLNGGSYNIKLSYPGYLDIEEKINVSGNTKNSFDYKFIKNAGTVVFTLTPNDATLTIDDQTTDARTVELKPGTYSIKISKENYFMQEDVVEIKVGDLINKDYKLIKNTGELNISITPNDAEFYINGERQTIKQGIELVPGKYKIEIKRDLYYSQDEMIDIQLNKTVSKEYKLEGKTGTLQLSVVPFEAKVELKQEDKVIKTWEGSLIEKGLLIGEYELKLMNSGYKTQSKIITITENKTSVEEIQLKEGGDVGGEFVYVEGGLFYMGSNEYSNENPIHSVTVNSFYIGKYEVTQKDWVDVMENNPSNLKGDNLPVEQVSWNDIQEFIIKLNQKTGKNYRLPTEAEWEYAARGGNKLRGYKYAGSNNIGDVAWYDDNSGSKTHQVGTKQPNELGIYDMSGNVWEWCSDWYGIDYYKNSPSNNPKGPGSGEYRVLRGGSWLNNANYCRTANRLKNIPNNRNYTNGFRLVQD